MSAIQNRSQRIESPADSVGTHVGAVSAFMQETILGWVYVEAKSVQDLDRALVGLADVRMRDGRVEKHLVHINELDDTRRMLTPRPPASICRGLFVRIICPGLYRYALGLVRKEVAEALEEYVVVASREKEQNS